MFRELMPLIQHRPLTVTVAAVNEKQIRVNVVPNQTERDKAANNAIGYTHKKEVASIPDTAIAALTTSLTLTGTPEEIDGQLAKTLTEFTALHVELQNSLNTASGEIRKAVKEIDERERLKKEQEKAGKNKKSETPKSEEKPRAKEEEGLPSLFTAPPAQRAVSANDPATQPAGAANQEEKHKPC